MMKTLAFIIFTMLTTAAALATDLSFSKQAANCPEDIRIAANVGDNNVFVFFKGKKFTLFSKGNYVFREKSSVPMTFDSYNRRKNSKRDIHIIYHHPAASGPSIGKIEFMGPKAKFICDVPLV